ncbi:MAG: sigma-70 family RNA polymerase sigma factor [Clostridia bacterium]|nr:sigma-70 family RNA polymerase sigma factor [Clostridia bacterium]
MHDDRIIELYFARDEQAIRHTADKYGAYCTAVSMNILHSEPDAEECVNDTYLKTWNSIPPTRPSSLRLFLAAIVRNLSLNRLRDRRAGKRNPVIEVSLEELSECIPAPNDQNEGELASLINEFLGTCSKTDRIIFVQRYFYSLSDEAIAEGLGLTRNAVSLRLSRTRKRLRVYLEERGYAI